MTIPVNALTITILSLILLALVATSYLAIGYILDSQKFKEPNRLRKMILMDNNLERRVDNLYAYIAWHVEDCSQVQAIKQGEYSVLCAFMVANAIEGLDRGQTTDILRQINEMARNLKNQTRQPHRKDEAEVAAVSDVVAGNAASVH